MRNLYILSLWSSALSLRSISGYTHRPLHHRALDDILVSSTDDPHSTKVSHRPSHVEIFNGEWSIFIWPCLAIWIFDRAVRLLRVLAFDRKIWNTCAIATYDSTSNIVRLEVSCEQNLVKPQPGAYYYIHVLNDLFFAHQNHPFTLAYISSSDIMTPPERSLRSSHRRTDPMESLMSSESSCLLGPASSPSPTLTFLIRPYDGLTSRLRRTCDSASKTPLRLLVEGPYGASLPLQTFPSVLFIAGGMGIAVALSYLSSLLAEDWHSNVGNIHIVWAVREEAFWREVLERDIKRSLLRDERFRITLHVTRNVEDGVKDVDDTTDRGYEVRGPRSEDRKCGRQGWKTGRERRRWECRARGWQEWEISGSRVRSSTDG